MLDSGIPERDEWPPNVLNALRQFRQGDLIEQVPFFYLADPNIPVFARTHDYAGQPPGVVEMAEGFYFRYGMISTQTCDIAEEGEGKPRFGWIQVCPVFNALAPLPGHDTGHIINGGDRKLIEAGRLQHFLHLPALTDGFWVADLRVEIPVERGWFADRQRIVGFASEEAQQEVGKRLAWLRVRPAFDTRFVESIQQPLVRSLRELHKADPEWYDRMHNSVPEVGILCVSRLDMKSAEVFVLYEDDLATDLADWWKEQWEGWHESADSRGITLQPIAFEDLNLMPAATYRNLTRLPLSNISNESAWYGADPENPPVPA